MESETKKVFDDGEIQLFQGPAPRSFSHYAAAWLAPVAIFAVAWLAMLALLLFFTGCSYAQKEQPISDKTGAALYAHPGEKATTEKYDAAGVERPRATVPVSTGNVENATQAASSLTGMLPGPFGFIAEGVLGAVTLATALALKAARKKRLEEYGLTEDEIIEDPQLRAKVEARASHEVKARIAQKARKKTPAPRRLSKRSEPAPTNFEATNESEQ